MTKDIETRLKEEADYCHETGLWREWKEGKHYCTLRILNEDGWEGCKYFGERDGDGYNRCNIYAFDVIDG